MTIPHKTHIITWNEERSDKISKYTNSTNLTLERDALKEDERMI
jgi:hypothetical protein